MRKSIVVLLIFVMVFSCLAGCNKKDTDKNTTTKVTDDTKVDQEESKEVGTLSLLMYTDWYKDGWKALETYINDNASELGFKLEISTIQGGQQGDQVIQTKFAADDLPDLIQVYKPMWVDAFCNGLSQLEDLSDLNCISEYNESDLNGTYKYNGTLYGIPIDTVTYANAVFYNKKVFEQYNITIPKTWDEFIEVLNVFKDTDLTPLFYSAADIWTTQMNACTSLDNDAYEAGEDISDFMGRINNNSEKYVNASNLEAAIERSKQLITNGYVQSSYISDTFDDAQQAIVDGTAAMYINGTWFTDNIASKFPDEIENIGVFVLPTPSGDNFVDKYVPYTLCVSKNGKKVDLAKKAVDFICSSKGQAIYAAAQPGIYYNVNVETDLCSAVKSLKDAASEKSMANWLESVKYSYGNFGEYLVNYYTGAYSEAIGVLKAMDDETVRNAVAAGESNWK